MDDLTARLEELRLRALDETLPLVDRLVALSQRLDLLTDWLLAQERGDR